MISQCICNTKNKFETQWRHANDAYLTFEFAISGRICGLSGIFFQPFWSDDIYVLYYVYDDICAVFFQKIITLIQGIKAIQLLTRTKLTRT